MSSPEQLAEARRWLRFATEDFRVAELLLASTEATPRQACYFAQQAAEKAIKALLVCHGTDFPKTHNLNTLRNLLPAGHRLAHEFPDLAELSAWVAEGRYPGDWPEPTQEDAGNAVTQARALLASIQDDPTFESAGEPDVTPPEED